VDGDECTVDDRALTTKDVNRSHDGKDLHQPPTELDLDRLQATTVHYYLHEANPANGLIRDKTQSGAPCSIAAVGLALATIPVLAVGAEWRCSALPRLETGNRLHSTSLDRWNRR
jgi:hypothetical protein